MRWCAIYTRVSTDKQEDSLENQVVYAKEFVSRLLGDSYATCDDLVYQDPDVSGYSTRWYDRPAIQQALADAEVGRFQVLVFKELSRISRDQDEHREIVGSFRQHGVRLIGINDSLDSDNENSMEFLPIRSWMAEMESKRIASRVSSGKKAAAKRGLWSGEAPIGYRLNATTRTLEVDPEHARTVLLIFSLYTSEGLGTFKVAERLNAAGLLSKYGRYWSRVTVNRVLRNQAYVGDTVYGKTQNEIRRSYSRTQGYEKIQSRRAVARSEWVIVNDTHPPIIDRDTFELAQEMLCMRSQRSLRRARWPLTGILRCGQCGSGMICQKRRAQSKSGEAVEYRYYSCANAFKFGRSMCSQRNIPAGVLEQVLLAKLRQAIGTFAGRIQIASETDVGEQRHRQERALLRRQQKCLIALDRLFQSSDLPEATFATLQAKYSAQLANIEGKLSDLREAGQSAVQPVDWDAESELLWERWQTRLETADPDALQRIFHDLLEEVTVFDRQIRSVTLRYRVDL